MAAHRKYSEKFKCEAVKMTRVAAITIGQVAQELDINENNVGTIAKSGGGVGPTGIQRPGSTDRCSDGCTDARVVMG
jgi:transposase-like protein